MSMYYVDLPDADIKDKAQTPGAIKRLIAAGRINQQTQICRVGDADWQPAYIYTDWWETPAPVTNKAMLQEVKAEIKQVLPLHEPITIDLVFQLLGWLCLVFSIGIAIAGTKDQWVWIALAGNGLVLLWMAAVAKLLRKILDRLNK